MNFIIKPKVETKQSKMKRCYYEILEVDKKATTSEIKTVKHFDNEGVS